MCVYALCSPVNPIFCPQACSREREGLGWASRPGPAGQRLATMSLVAALAHFCEYHGPCVVLSTQMFSDRDPAVLCGGSGEGSPNRLAGGGGGGGDDDDVLVGCRRLLASARPSAARAVCEGCSSTESPGHVFVSGEPSAGRSWISSQHCLAPGLEPVLKRAALRAVSGEVADSREGPVFFADSAVGSVLSHNFFLRDSRARGFQRYYSLLLAAREREGLAAAWGVVMTDARAFIGELKAKAEASYAREFYPGEAAVPPRDEKCGSKAGLRRTSYRPVRNLRELTSDPRVFQFVHRSFVRLLQRTAGAVSERPLAGQPLSGAAHRQAAEPEVAMAADMHRQLGGDSFGLLLYAVLSGGRLVVRLASVVGGLFYKSAGTIEK